MQNQSEFRLVVIHGRHNHAGVLFDESGTRIASAWGATKREAVIRTVERYIHPAPSQLSQHFDRQLQEEEGTDLLKDSQ